MPVRMAFHLFNGHNRNALYRVYRRSKIARFFFITLALVSQALALLVIGMIGLLLGALVRSLFS
jgi:hypothetical protein